MNQIIQEVTCSRIGHMSNEQLCWYLHIYALVGCSGKLIHNRIGHMKNFQVVQSHDEPLYVHLYFLET